jgi:hypothetical protein
LRFHLFAAAGATFVGPPSDPTESERIEWIPHPRLRHLIASHQVPDGLSLTALLWWLVDRG